MGTCWLDPCDTFHPLAEYADVGYHMGASVELQRIFPAAHESAIGEGLREAGEQEPATILSAMHLPGSLTSELTIRGHPDEARFTVLALTQTSFREG
jgi:hypothetical protein